MKRLYKLSAGVTVSAVSYVWARTPEEAVQRGKGRNAALEGEHPDVYDVFVIEDADGAPMGVTAEEIDPEDAPVDDWGTGDPDEREDDEEEEGDVNEDGDPDAVEIDDEE